MKMATRRASLTPPGGLTSALGRKAGDKANRTPTVDTRFATRCCPTSAAPRMSAANPGRMSVSNPRNSMAFVSGFDGVAEQSTFTTRFGATVETDERLHCLRERESFMLNVVTTLKEQLGEERQARARAREVERPSLQL